MATKDYDIRVLILEDQDDVRAILCKALTAPSIQVAWQGATLGAALDYLARNEREAPIDLALVDLGLPDAYGTEAISRIRARHPNLNVLVLTLFDDGPTVLAALRAGARGYLTKHVKPEALTQAVRSAAQGESPMTPRIARFLVDAWVRDEELRPTDSLTDREREVLALLSQGKAYAGVAAQMEIGIGTVQSYVKSIYGKLGVNTRNEAASLARRWGLIA